MRLFCVMAITSFNDLLVYQKSYEYSIEIRIVTMQFPAEEKYLLADQMNRASRSIPANLAEGWAKRSFEKIFKRHLIDSIGSGAEMQVHLCYAKDFGYISIADFEKYTGRILEINGMLHNLHLNWKTNNRQP